MMQPPASPLRYDPSVETPEPDEAKTGRELVETLRQISEITYGHSGHAIRSVHAKSHGLLNAKLEVAGNLPPQLAQGLFAKPGSYKAVMRFSTSPGDLLDDVVSTPRGLALKILDVPGEQVEALDTDTTSQDFLMVNGPVFRAPTGKKFLGDLKLLAKTTDRAEGLKKVLSVALHGAEKLLEAVGSESSMLKSLGGHPYTHALSHTFFTQTPVRYGEYIAKLSLAPASDELKALKDVRLDAGSEPNALRNAIVEFFRTHDAAWDLRVQLCTDLETMPVEDSTIAWPEDKSPFIPVARLTAPKQNAWSGDMTAEVDDCMSFSPWHALAAHRPLGSIMRLRKQAYHSSAEFRQSRNGCPMHAMKAAE